MSAGFDPYYTWLAIPPEEQPPHLYRLLGVKPLEQNLDVLETAADRQMKHLRDYQSGKNADSCQKLLNEISAAKLALLDPAKKSAYDAELRAKLNAAKQAELKKAREERPLAIAKPLPTAAPLAAKTAAPQFQFDAPAAKSSAAPRKSSAVALIAAVAGVALLVLVGGGIAATMFVAGRQRVSAVQTPTTNDKPSSDTPGTETPSTTTPLPPVIPPRGNGETPATDPPASVDDDPATESPAVTEPDVPIDESPQEPSDEGGGEEVALTDETSEPEAPAKLPIPDKAVREAKRKEILAIFPITKARTPHEKSELVTQLLATASESDDDADAQFALLNLARETAAELGDVERAFTAVDMLEEAFDFDADAVRVVSLQQASKAALPPAAKREIAVAGMEVIDSLAAADRFDEADTLSDRMLSIARPLRDAELIKSIADQKRGIDELAASYKKAQTAFETLKTSPDDAEANLAAGKYLAFVKQDWVAGVEHLAKGSDAALAAAAKAELAAPETPAEQEELADAWWAAADGQKESVIKDHCRAQAGHWYREIVDGLSGLTKVKIEKRIAEVGDLVAASESSSGPNRRVDLETVFLDDLQETDSKVGYGSLGKHGRKHDGQPTTIAGEKLTHSLETHPVTRGTAYVTYDVDGKAEQFEAIAAIRDGSGAAASPLVFRVVGDGNVLWQSPPMQRHNSAQPCRVKVRGIKALSLQVVCSGAMDEGNSLWINPRISRVKDESEPDLGIFSRDPAELETGNDDRENRGVEIAYLDDMQESEVKFNHHPLRKHGRKFIGDEVGEFNGETPAHSLSIHAVSRDFVGVSYELDGTYEFFEGTAGQWDDRVGGMSNSPLTFSVICDDKLAWKSKPSQTHGIGQDFRIAVKGVKRLTLRMDCPGDMGAGWPVWVGPRLTRKAARSKPDALAEIPATENFIYLDDIAESEVNVAFTFGKHGVDWTGERTANFMGKVPAHSLATHPPSDGTASVSYKLEGKFDTFEGHAGQWDYRGAMSKTPVTFRVLGDGKVLWESQPIQRHGGNEGCKVSVRGVKVLTLQAICPGEASYCLAVWGEPRITPRASLRKDPPKTIGGSTTPRPRPTVRATIPKQAIKFRGHRYLVVPTPANRADAEAACADVGGHLVRIESAEEQQFVQRLVPLELKLTNEVWIDGSDAAAEGIWRFSNGAAMTWTNWSRNEPNNTRGAEHFATIGTVVEGAYGWNDAVAEHVNAYICEWDE